MKTVRDYLLAQQSQIEAALPAFMNPTRFLRAAFTEFSKTPTLYECSTRSLLGALIQCAQLGLEPGVLGHIYLVPFKNRRRGTVEVTVIPGYRGLLQLARRSGEISTINAHVVYQGDHFKYSYGLDPSLEHQPSDEPRSTKVNGAVVERPMTHVYAACRLKDGGVQFEVMTRADVEYHRDRYANVRPDSAWETNFEEMALKTVLRRLCRLLPAATDLQRAVMLDSQARHGEPQNLSTLVAGAESAVEEAEPEPAEDQDAAAPGDATGQPGGTPSVDPHAAALMAVAEEQRKIAPPLAESEWHKVLKEIAGTTVIETVDVAVLEDALLPLLRGLVARDKAAQARLKAILTAKA